MMDWDDEDSPGGSVAGVWGEVAVAPPRDAHPFTISDSERYVRGGLIGRGGMGNVFSARDRRLNREVALKEVTVSAGRSGQDRLAQEAWITGQLEHPNIVPVHDAGTDANGTPWYTMRLIRGRTLFDVLEGADHQTRLSTLRHILAACEAMAYAHSRGIVHRDLKPENILVGSFGETQVADWGLARPLDGEEEHWDDVVPSEHVAATMVGAAVGTPAWMSPEQLRGEPATRRSDVWSLGAVLRQVVTGRVPWPGLDNSQVLSERLSSGDRVFEGSLAGPDVLAARSELEAIVRHAMAPDPAHRYADASELSADLERFLDGRRVHAHEYSALDLLRRLTTLWRAPLLVGLVASLALSVAVGVGWNRTAKERMRAQHNLTRALLHQAQAAESAGDRPAAEVLAAEVLAIEESPAARGVLAGFAVGERPRVQATSLPSAECGTAQILGPDTWLCVRDDQLSAFRLGTDEPLWQRTLQPHLLALMPSPGELFVSQNRKPLLRLDPSTGETVESLPAFDFPEHLIRSPNGRYLLGWRVHVMAIWDSQTSQTTAITGCEPPNAVNTATFGEDSLLLTCADLRVGIVAPAAPSSEPFEHKLPGGLWSGGGTLAAAHLGQDRFAITTHRGELALYDAATGALAQTLDIAEHGLIDVIVSASGQRLAIRGVRGDVYLLDLGADFAVPLPTRGARDMAFEPDGTLLVLGAEWQRWALPARGPVRRINAGAGVTTVRVSPDGSTLLAATGSGDLLVWRPDEDSIRRVHVFGGVIKDMAFTPDATSAVLAASVPDPVVRRAVRLSDLQLTNAAPIVGLRRSVVLRDGTLVAVSWGPSGPISSSDLQTTAINLDWSDGPLQDLAADADGQRVVAVGENERVHVGELTEDGLVESWSRVVAGALRAQIHRSGLTAVGTPGGVQLLQPDGRPGLLLEAPAVHFTDLAFSPDGGTLAAGDLSGSIWVWDTNRGQLLAELRGHTSRASGIEFRGEDELVSCSWDGTVRRWDVRPLRADLASIQADTATWGLTLADVLDERR